MQLVKSDEVRITHTVDGEPLQPDGTVAICFRKNATDGDFVLIRGAYMSESCLEDLDIVDEQPEVHREGDHVLVCGVTDHFTTFSLLLIGGDDGLSLVSRCSSAEGFAVPLMLWLLHLIAVGVALTCIVCIVWVVWHNRQARKVVYGSEGDRIVEVRKSRDRYVERQKSRTSYFNATVINK